MHSVAGWGLDAVIEKDKDGGVHFWGETVEGGQLIGWEQSTQTRLPDGLLNGLCCAVQADEITRRAIAATRARQGEPRHF